MWPIHYGNSTGASTLHTHTHMCSVILGICQTIALCIAPNGVPERKWVCVSVPTANWHGHDDLICDSISFSLSHLDLGHKSFGTCSTTCPLSVCVPAGRLDKAQKECALLVFYLHRLASTLAPSTLTEDINQVNKISKTIKARALQQQQSAAFPCIESPLCKVSQTLATILYTARTLDGRRRLSNLWRWGSQQETAASMSTTRQCCVFNCCCYWCCLLPR